MQIEDTDNSLRRLRGELSQLTADLRRVRLRGAVWPVLTVAVLMLFWPTFDPAGAGDRHGGPVTSTGLCLALGDRELGFLSSVAGFTVLLQVALIIGLAVLLDTDSTTAPRFVQVAAVAFGAVYLVLVFLINQDDRAGTFGQDGYQPSGSWLLMMAMAAAAVGVATWVRSEQG